MVMDDLGGLWGPGVGGWPLNHDAEEEAFGGVLGSDLLAPGRNGDGESWWVDHKPLQAQGGSEGPGMEFTPPLAWNTRLAMAAPFYLLLGP